MLIGLLQKIGALMIILALGFALYSPESIPFAPAQTVFSGSRRMIFGSDLSAQGVLNHWYRGAQTAFLKFADTANLPKQVEMPEEIVIEDVVEGLTMDIKELPKEQVRRVKARFCEDLINEATVAGMQTNIEPNLPDSELEAPLSAN